ncbi:serine/threonine-protein kinase [Nocardioides marmotae]|uniref:serine/threonine-protein kinase n=1 Tax=Nocardioides marmotae TaxID=2663857 RepID=UPI0012B52646|nr:serine/threonine-protein kinase [Nocardioides marmotae]MBC9732358.1 serine/threonine protein kinase [Nocardioides marmotae]MTB83479.1 protein kinase [Nocardioides marmotae]
MSDPTVTFGAPEPRYADDARRYRLESRIATGGMGEVWRATDTTLGREVAVKLLKHEYADDATFRSRFETEARHAASLHHPGVAAVYDFGEAAPADGSGVPRPYLVMELVDGQPLSALLREGQPLDPDAVRHLLVQVADAVGAAHAAGIVHRDIKPANLLVTPDRVVKITDFGIARAADGIGMTQTGQVMGTPQYLSPEQARGNTATPASDVYALGVVAFEMLAGHRPFQADSPVATALAHLNDPVPDLPDSVPADLAAVVHRAMAKDPADRYADASAFAAALRDPSTELFTAPGAAEQTEVLSRTAVAAPLPAEATTVAPTGATALADETGAEADEAAATRRRRALVVGLLVAVLVVAGIVAALALGGRGDDDPGDTPSVSAGTVTIDEDDYLDRPVDEVRRELTRARLRVRTDEVANPGGRTPGLVTSVDPSGRLDEGELVTVQFWGPEPAPEPTPEPTTEAPTEEPTTEAPSPEPTTTEAPTQEPSSPEGPTEEPTTSTPPTPTAPSSPTQASSSPPSQASGEPSPTEEEDR